MQYYNSSISTQPTKNWQMGKIKVQFDNKQNWILLLLIIIVPNLFVALCTLDNSSLKWCKFRPMLCAYGSWLLLYRATSKILILWHMTPLFKVISEDPWPFDIETFTTSSIDVSLSWPRFEHPTFHIRSERSNQLHYRCDDNDIIILVKWFNNIHG